MRLRRAEGAAAERGDALTPEKERFIEALGVLYERQGVPRIGGRMLGLFLISDEPRSPERIAELLKVSRASVSTNLRVFTTLGICDHVSVPGDRRRYYVLREDGFARHLESNMDNLRKLTELCRGALGTVPSGRSPARRRLQAAVAYCEFIEKEIAATLARWHSRRSR